jgi:hypothetical protein
LVAHTLCIDAILCLRRNPKLSGVYDAEIVGCGAAEFARSLGRRFAQEAERRGCEVLADLIGFVVRYVFVHHPPQALDRVQMRAAGGDGMQSDPATGPRQPLFHELGVMVSRVVWKHVDERHQGIERLDRFQQADRR